jgi:hypothetical protein
VDMSLVGFKNFWWNIEAELEAIGTRVGVGL